MINRFCSFLSISFFLFTSIAFGQSSEKTKWDSTSYSGIKMRSVGPAFMSGRIVDIAIDPSNTSHWYIAVGSGGVWETKNAGVTFKPIFDNQKVYSVGCITIDPSNTNTVWVGTGENDGGRHISFGDGVYRSNDGGKSWKNMGLKSSEHISKIVVHPKNSNIIWVASQGPLWNEGGERGVYKSTDGGKTWKRTLGDDEWTGATELILHPTNHNVMYAATWQRHRTVANYMGGGPKSGIHKSTDGGETWTKLKGGLPGGNMGKIGLAMSPQKPDVLYAAVELNLRKGAVYRTANSGATWKKMSDQVARGTGPHYYQELFPCPHNFDRIYFANNYFLVSDDGGKTFRNVKKKGKHVDNHALAFRADDPNYLLVGTDGGLYESFDLAESWRHFGNMPITQFYKIAIDDSKPFYNIYGGTQDNSTQGGPSRTDNRSGIINGDWYMVNGGDGHQPATEPGNPRVVYAQSQQGYYTRIDMETAERTPIRPQPGEGEDDERYNWDAPILVSPHSPTTVYVASYRLWKSEDRGNEWKAISDDLTRDEERFDMPIMGKKQSFNSPYDVYAMSTYNTITSIAESPVQKDLLYVGTDDGLIQISEDGGKTWEETEVSELPGVDDRMYVNDIKADLYDANTVYVALDNHKTGDYAPYLFKSTNKGKSWKSIASNLPDRDYVWRIVQDHKNKNLLFVGTEFGLYFSPSGGEEWIRIKGGLPTISFRDLAIHQREDDLVAASFGRSIYILDDITPLRELTEEVIAEDAHLFNSREAKWFKQRLKLGYGKAGSTGGQHFIADNPPYGAIFTYHVNKKYKSAKSERLKEEKEYSDSDIDFPGWEALEKEKNEMKPSMYLIVRDQEGNFVRRIKAPSSKGFHRVAWEFNETSAFPINMRDKSMSRGGYPTLPGEYTVSLYYASLDSTELLSGPVSFKVKPLENIKLNQSEQAKRLAYVEEYKKLTAEVREYRTDLRKAFNKQVALTTLLLNTPTDHGAYESQLKQLKTELVKIEQKTSGMKSKSEVGEKTRPTLQDRLWAAGGSLYSSSQEPTTTARQCFDIAQKQVAALNAELALVEAKLNTMYKKLREEGGPVILDWQD